LAKVRQRAHYANGPVTAHSKKPGAVEVDDARGARWIRAWNQERTNQHFISARLAHHCGPKPVMMGSQIDGHVMHRSPC
jgi:hypothetical protein